MNQRDNTSGELMPVTSQARLICKKNPNQPKKTTHLQKTKKQFHNLCISFLYSLLIKKNFTEEFHKNNIEISPKRSSVFVFYKWRFTWEVNIAHF